MTVIYNFSLKTNSSFVKPISLDDVRLAIECTPQDGREEKMCFLLEPQEEWFSTWHNDYFSYIPFHIYDWMEANLKYKDVTVYSQYVRESVVEANRVVCLNGEYSNPFNSLRMVRYKLCGLKVSYSMTKDGKVNFNASASFINGKIKIYKNKIKVIRDLDEDTYTEVWERFLSPTGYIWLITSGVDYEDYDFQKYKEQMVVREDISKYYQRSHHNNTIPGSCVDLSYFTYKIYKKLMTVAYPNHFEDRLIASNSLDIGDGKYLEIATERRNVKISRNMNSFRKVLDNYNKTYLANFEIVPVWYWNFYQELKNIFVEVTATQSSTAWESAAGKAISFINSKMK